MLLGVEVAIAHQVIKKSSKWIIWGSTRYMTYPTPCRNVFIECDRKKRTNKACIPVTELRNTCTRWSNKHLFEISCKSDKRFVQKL